METKKGEQYIVGIRLDEVRRQACAGGCGSHVFVAELAWKQAQEHARDMGMHPSSVKGVCRQCLQGSNMVPSL